MSLARHVVLRPLCRLTQHIPRASLTPIRSLSTTAVVQRNPSREGGKRSKSFGRDGQGGLNRTPSRYRVTAPPPTVKLRPTSLPVILSGRLDEWVASDRLHDRLAAYGFSEEEGQEVANAWRDKTKSELNGLRAVDVEGIPQAMADQGWDAPGLIAAYESGSWSTQFEGAFLRHLLEYARVNGPEHLRLHIGSILTVTDVSNIAQTYLHARSLSRRFHLHMGPTNSGKTYNALKALSKAKTGVYAGPLRLLAHEVWERINLGSVGELGGVGRACNLITGEERRVVEPDAGLVSCTVEMLPLNGNNGGEPWDVVVIDEIQMLGDPQRGGAWTSALMGTNARDIHLCGDETTAQLLASMIDSFKGDTLTIHKYDRLTPLSVADEALEGNWNNVKPGDCIVTFSRSNVFAVKRAVEGTLGTRCAVVYGALPPETRADQAREFNDEAGRAEVLVASDAVGMGLNLKIGRIIFESMSKFDGRREVPLSLSQVKQIAGRAGRFGQQRPGSNMDEVPSPGGVVTTLHGADLPLLRHMLPLPLPPITRAILEVPFDGLVHLSPLLPPDTTLSDLIAHFCALAKLPPYTVMVEATNKIRVSDMIEEFRDVLPLAEADVLTKAPINSRDHKVVSIFMKMAQSFVDDYHVDLDKVLEPSTLLVTLKDVEETLAALPPLPAGTNPGPEHAPPLIVTAIPLLESLHKSLVLYIWLSYRLELAFPDRDLASEYKLRTERVLETCLERLPGVKHKKGALARASRYDPEAQGEQAKTKVQYTHREDVDKSGRRRKWANVSVAHQKDQE